MLLFWRKNEREERDLRKKAEKEAIDRAKREEELREARRQARKLNFLITQTELYSHFVGKKVGTEDTGVGIEGPSPIPSGSGDLPSKFDELDFDADDDEALRAAAARSAQNAVTLAQNKAKDFDLATRSGEAKPPGDIDMKDIDIDAEDMNFTNPTGLSELEQIPQPKMLHCQLKEYQLKGLNWLVNLYEQGINGILADEMGLGKTVQSISVMAYLAENHNVWGPFLVIAPASTLHNWQQELSRFVPGLKALPYWGNAKDRKVLRKFWNRKHVTYTQDAPFHVLVTSYQLVVQDEKYFQKIKWQYMILDEAQAIKSSSSSRWKILLGLHCRNRLLLTGTPIQNTMQGTSPAPFLRDADGLELWALLHFIMPTLFDSHEEFSEWFSKDIESHTQSNTKLNQQQLRRLHMILKPFMLRRNKRDVQSELPAKLELDIYCNLSYRQRDIYKTLRERISIGDLLERAMSGEAKGDESLMNLVMQFRKVCNHPDLFERADVRSPLAFVSFGVTANLSREGSQLSLAYTTRNRITYEMPKLVYRGGGVLNVPGEESDAGSRRKLLDNLMSIWQADYIESAMKENDSALSFLRFVNTSPTELAKAWRGDDISYAVESINKTHKIAVNQAVYDDGEGYNEQHSMMLIPGTTTRFPLKEVTNEKVMAHLCNVADESFRSERLHVMDPMYDLKVCAPPIDINCSDRTFVLEQNDCLFDAKSRRALFGILPLEENKLAEAGEILDIGAIPPQGLLGSAILERSGYTSIRVPEMHRFVTDSGKLATLDRLLGELKAGGHRVLLYFQMTRMMDLIEEYLTYRQYKYLRLDGSSKIGDRRDMVNDWQTRSDLFVFVLSTRAGGLGINLTAADTVIFYDSDWNPTVDSQAMDRAHRLGQTKQVTVYRLITRNSIEERILLRAKQKEEVFLPRNRSANNRFNGWLFLATHSKRLKSISTRAILVTWYPGSSTTTNSKNNSVQLKQNVKPKKPK
jgi:chromatin-remodeling ATPase INO80